jgi:hypothetical protein
VPGRADSGREAGSSIWSGPTRDAAPGRPQDDPLTSTAYSRSALTDTDGRSYRVAARRSQAQAKLTEQTESQLAGQYQQGSYPRYQGSGARPGAERPTGSYETSQGRPPQHREPGQHQPAQHQPAQHQPAPHQAGPLPAPAPSGGRPTAPTGRNPYDSEGTGSYPYPASQPYPGVPGSPPAADNAAGRYRPQSRGGGPGAGEPGRADQPAPGQARPGYSPGYGSGQRPY